MVSKAKVDLPEPLTPVMTVQVVLPGTANLDGITQMDMLSGLWHGFSGRLEKT
jgi:hypothetical protein